MFVECVKPDDFPRHTNTKQTNNNHITNAFRMAGNDQIILVDYLNSGKYLIK